MPTEIIKVNVQYKDDSGSSVAEADFRHIIVARGYRGTLIRAKSLLFVLADPLPTDGSYHTMEIAVLKGRHTTEVDVTKLLFGEDSFSGGFVDTDVIYHDAAGFFSDISGTPVNQVIMEASKSRYQEEFIDEEIVGGSRGNQLGDQWTLVAWVSFTEDDATKYYAWAEVTYALEWLDNGGKPAKRESRAEIEMMETYDGF